MLRASKNMVGVHSFSYELDNRHLGQIFQFFLTVHSFSYELDTEHVSLVDSAVTLGPKLYETVRGKLSLGARILHAGGVENVFRRWFAVEKGEKLLKASQCYLSTTAGPIAGMLFVSSERVAFRSDRSLALTSPTGDTVRVPYKVDIPLRRVKTAKPSENKHRPEQKYVQVVTDDGFEFWFMGFVGYQASLQHLEQAIAQAQL